MLCGIQKITLNSECLKRGNIGNSIEKIVGGHVTKSLMLQLYGLHPVGHGFKQQSSKMCTFFSEMTVYYFFFCAHSLCNFKTTQKNIKKKL